MEQHTRPALTGRLVNFVGAISLGLVVLACNATAPGGSPSPVPPTAPPTASPTAPPTATPTPAPPAGLDGRTFLSTAVTRDGEPVTLVADTRIRLSFTNGSISANAGCNMMGGTYTVDDDHLVVGPMFMTEMACDPARSAQDQWLADFLGSRPLVTLAGNDLVLATDDTTVTMLDREIAEPDLPLAGTTWTLESIVSGDSASSVPVGVTAALLFSADGTVAVQYGCNTGGGSYSTEGGAITFEQLAMTRMACRPPADGVEAAMLAVLNAEAISYVIDSSTLTLNAGDKGLQFTGALNLPD